MAEVFEHLLATDRELRQEHGLARIMEGELDFQRRMAASLSNGELCALDESTLQGRAETWNRIYEQLSKFLRHEPFRQLCSKLGGEGLALADAEAALGADAFFARAYETFVENGQSLESLAREMTDNEMARRGELNALRNSDIQSAALAHYLDELDRIALRLLAEKACSKSEAALHRAYAEQNVTPRMVVEQEADNMLAGMRMRKIRPDRFQGMLSRALRQRESCLNSGDFMGALKAVNNARVANAMLGKALTIQELGRDLEKLAGPPCAGSGLDWLPGRLP